MHGFTSKLSEVTERSKGDEEDEMGFYRRTPSRLLSSPTKQYLAVIAFFFLVARWAFYGPLISLDGSGFSSSLDEEAEPSHRMGSFQIVVAHTKARPTSMQKWLNQIRAIPFISELGVETTVYTKGKIHDLNQFLNVTASDHIYRLRNHGREAGTFLHHIVKNYDDLADYTMFIHEEPVGIVEATGLFDEAHYDALRYNFDNTTEFLNHGLNEAGVGWCSCGECEGRAGKTFPMIQQVRRLWTKKQCYGKQRTVLFHQFIVSRERIVERPQWLYAYLLELVTAPKDHWIHQQKEPSDVREWIGGTSTPEHPLFLYTVERLWSGLFGCEDDPWADGCRMFLERDGPAKDDVGLAPALDNHFH